MSYKIIVARYNEDIKWLKSEMSNCIILNKGEPLNIPNEHILKNVGRESESYLNYIIMNYDNLPDIMVFTQANIADHRGKNDIEYLLNLKKEANQHGQSIPIIKHSISTINCCWDPEFNKRLSNYCWWDPEMKRLHEQYFLERNYQNNTPITFINWFKKYIQNEYPNPIYIYYNAIFAVSKRLVLKHSIEYYKRLRETVDHSIDPAEGHFFERSWFYIFS